MVTINFVLLLQRTSQIGTLEDTWGITVNDRYSDNFAEEGMYGGLTVCMGIIRASTEFEVTSANSISSGRV